MQRSFLIFALLTAALLARGDISDTKHNLSVSGPGPIKSVSEQEICVFCHAPHRARVDTGLLWNRADSAVMTYDSYVSSTMHATPEQPSGATKLCLSCHDGTVALNTVLSRSQPIDLVAGITHMPDGNAKLGTDLSDDHPVSIVYDEHLAGISGALHSPSALIGEVSVDATGRLQCTACHDPHDDSYGKFLTRPLNYSMLCLTCHDLADWDASGHATSMATWNGIGQDPWPDTSFDTVAENACLNCHVPHDAASDESLLRAVLEEQNCIGCHDGGVSTTDILSELDKPFAHAVQTFSGIHRAGEDPAGLTSKHVECADCHNPHRVSSFERGAPLVGGTQLGVTGVGSTGLAVGVSNFTFEICFKCHADNNVTSFVEISRQLPQINTRLEFDITNPSFHPLQGPGRNPSVPSLISPLNENSVVACMDCHANDNGPGAQGSGPAGPHGSVNRYLLERNYTTLDGTMENGFEYALCYKCHDRNSILGDQSFSAHSLHVEQVRAPCSVCHDPHGVSSSQGNPINNSHLINFDINVVSPNSGGRREFVDLGAVRGTCSLSCHAREHDEEAYP